jgi:hypothetical protein
MRAGSPLWYFSKGESDWYIFPTDDGVEDYDADYQNNKSFCELMGNIVLRESKDEKYALKIVRILARKLGCSEDLLDKRKSCEDWYKEMDKKIKDSKKRGKK